jgi:predicted dienelactone hydrolase
MRTFEVALIVVNLISLFLQFKQQSQTVWLWTAGTSLTLFYIHGVFEGFRYQMVFSYMFILFVMFALARAVCKPKTRTPKVLKVIVIGLAFVFLGVTSFLSYALPVFTLPEPTGDYAVGVQYFRMIDKNRLDPFLDQSTKRRELMVKVYYPAQEDASKPFLPYFHSPELIKSFAEFYGMPGFMFDHFNLVKTNSKENLQISDEQQRYPVILFSHGAGTSMEVQTSQSENLASHGYIVVAIDHTYVSSATVFPDRIVSHKEATTDFNIVEPAEIITQIMSDDATFVMEELVKMNDGKIDSIFEGRLDLGKIGALGHSVGGAAAYNLAINDRRVKAAVDLDGVVYITPKEEPTDTAPFLMLASDIGHVQTIENRTPLMKRFEDMDDIEQKITVEIHGSEEAYTKAYNKAQQNVAGLSEVLRTSGTLFTIEGSDHMKFTDIGLFIGFPQLRELIGIGGTADPLRCLEITNSVTVAFFDQHLKGETGDPLESLLEKYPELKRIDLE